MARARAITTTEPVTRRTVLASTPPKVPPLRSGASPGTMTSSVTRPRTMVAATVISANRVAPATDTANGQGWVRTERHRRAMPRCSTVGSSGVAGSSTTAAGRRRAERGRRRSWHPASNSVSRATPTRWTRRPPPPPEPAARTQQDRRRETQVRSGGEDVARLRWATASLGEGPRWAEGGPRVGRGWAEGGGPRPGRSGGGRRGRSPGSRAGRGRPRLSARAVAARTRARATSARLATS